NQAVDARTVLTALREGRQPRRRRTGLIVAVAGFAVAAAVVAVVVPLSSTREAAPVGPAANQDHKVAPLGDQNILLVGMDTDPAREDGVANADTVVLVRRTTDGAFHAMSIPRDGYVDIPGFGVHKVNSAYARGSAGVKDPAEAVTKGTKTLVDTVQNLTGVKV